MFDVSPLIARSASGEDIPSRMASNCLGIASSWALGGKIAKVARVEHGDDVCRNQALLHGAQPDQRRDRQYRPKVQKKRLSEAALFQSFGRPRSPAAKRKRR